MDSAGALNPDKSFNKVRSKTRRSQMSAAFVCLLLTSLSVSIFAQQAPQQPQTPRTPRDSAQVDLTGNWVSLVTEEWLWRMTTPPKGDYASVPLNPEGRKLADSWDLAKDAA